jgi:hypothetical protein
MKASAALAGLVALLALTGQAPAVDPAPPLTINWCAFSAWTLTTNGSTGQLLVHFTPSTALKTVRFRMLWADNTFTVVDDAGSFASGSEIRHALDFQHYGQFTGNTLLSMSLAPERVVTADGRTWEAPLHGAPSTKCGKYFGR